MGQDYNADYDCNLTFKPNWENDGMEAIKAFVALKRLETNGDNEDNNLSYEIRHLMNFFGQKEHKDVKELLCTMFEDDNGLECNDFGDDELTHGFYSNNSDVTEAFDIIIALIAPFIEDGSYIESVVNVDCERYHTRICIVKGVAKILNPKITWDVKTGRDFKVN